MEFISRDVFWKVMVNRGRAQQCWPWAGPKNSFGYGVVKYDGKPWMAHRLAYFLTHGTIPHAADFDPATGSNYVIMHTCDNPCCCNPEHLVLGTVEKNNADRAAKGRNGKYRRRKPRVFTSIQERNLTTGEVGEWRRIEVTPKTIKLYGLKNYEARRLAAAEPKGGG